jgi:CubicO group peptidase (beta-lactamase class C family)
VYEYFWGGAPATAFWTDPREELTVVFMTQVIGSEAHLTLRRDLRTLVRGDDGVVRVDRARICRFDEHWNPRSGQGTKP